MDVTHIVTDISLDNVDNVFVRVFRFLGVIFLAGEGYMNAVADIHQSAVVGVVCIGVNGRAYYRRDLDQRRVSGAVYNMQSAPAIPTVSTLPQSLVERRIREFGGTRHCDHPDVLGAEFWGGVGKCLVGRQSGGTGVLIYQNSSFRIVLSYLKKLVTNIYV